jgi:hypothetical protein
MDLLGNRSTSLVATMEPAGPAPTMMMSYALAGDGRTAWTDEGMTAPAARRDVFLRKSRRFTCTSLPSRGHSPHRAAPRRI